MLPVNVLSTAELPRDLDRNWLCIPCPEGTRCLLLAADNTTHAYDLDGNLLCTHDTHLPAGSCARVSQVTDHSVCTVLDCLYNEEQQIYYVIDVLCWNGESLYRQDTQYRHHYMHEQMAKTTSLFKISQTNPYTFHPLTSCSCMALTLARAIANVSYQMTGLLFYHKDACYTPGVTPLGCWLETHLIQSVLPVTLHQSFLYQTQQALIATTCQVQQREFRRSRYECPQSMFCSDYWKRQYYKDNHNSEWDSFKMSSISGQRYGYNNYCHNKPTGFNKRRHRVKTKRGDYDSAKQQIMGQEIDSTPNWDEWDRHDVMMSVIMEKIPERFAEDWIGVICPVAKRRIVVAYNGSTCSYNKLGVLDRKFQSRLPGGNTLFVQVIKNNDMCILDCLHLKAERTFYVLDVMHWKQMPYYESETDFRFHWIKDKLAEIPLNLVDEQNEYMFKNLSRFPCTQQDIMDAMKKTRWKVDGMLFFHKTGWYVPGVSPSVLWLTPENVEPVLGLQLPENFMFPKKKKDVAPLSSASTSLTTTVSGLYKADGDSMSNPIVISEEAYENTSVPAPVSDSRMVSDGKIAADNESVSGVTGQLSESREELKNTERHHPVP
ncbi:uncharacterized protein LOC112553693 isoform X2 [Pomacea canaliculata]|nr:uncharacterized protein LOC112553693 isoform X2 [Pomacea canaliculata]